VAERRRRANDRGQLDRVGNHGGDSRKDDMQHSIWCTLPRVGCLTDVYQGGSGVPEIIGKPSRRGVQTRYRAPGAVHLDHIYGEMGRIIG
jgi:hypothetical protein